MYRKGHVARNGFWLYFVRIIKRNWFFWLDYSGDLHFSSMSVAAVYSSAYKWRSKRSWEPPLVVSDWLLTEPRLMCSTRNLEEVCVEHTEFMAGEIKSALSTLRVSAEYVITRPLSFSSTVDFRLCWPGTRFPTMRYVAPLIRACCFRRRAINVCW